MTVSDDEEIYHIIQEAGVLPHSLRPRVHRRQVARTRMSERIYRQIQEIRRSRFNRRMIILSDSESSEESEHDLSDEVNKIYFLLSKGIEQGLWIDFDWAIELKKETMYTFYELYWFYQQTLPRNIRRCIFKFSATHENLKCSQLGFKFPKSVERPLWNDGKSCK